MTVILGLAIGLILGGLLMAFLSGSMKYPLLISIVFWVGIVLVVVGLVLLLTPVLVWLNGQLRAMLGQP